MNIVKRKVIGISVMPFPVFTAVSESTLTGWFLEGAARWKRDVLQSKVSSSGLITHVSCDPTKRLRGRVHRHVCQKPLYLPV